MRSLRKQLLRNLVMVVLVLLPVEVMAENLGKPDQAIDKWVRVFQPSALSPKDKIGELKWFHKVSKPLRGMKIRSTAEMIDTHYWERDVLAKAFEEITGIRVEHDIIHEGELIRRITEQMMTGRVIYHAYVNDSDMIGTHLRLNRVVDFGEYMRGEGKPYTNPRFALDDFLNLEFGQDYDGNQLQIPDEQFPSLYWFRYDWFTDPATQKSFKTKYGYELGVPVNWEAYEDIAEFFTGRQMKNPDGSVVKAYGHLDYGNPSPDLGWRFTDAWLSIAGAGDKGLPNGMPVDEWGIRVEDRIPVGSTVERGGDLDGPAAVYARAVDRGLDFTLEQSPDLPHYINFDQGKLRQVLINLIGNAIKYTKNGVVILRATVVKQEPPDRVRLEFEVEDTGPGIREEDRERIFSPFVQLGERPPTEAGTGLGLTICKQYVELMSGTISVDSEPGKGSVFRFEVPVEVLPTAATPAEPRRGRVIGLTEGQPRYRLLIAEDQPENRLLLHKLLEPFGFELREAANGEDTVALFEECRPHLIFMDIRMPVMDGLEATRRIKATHAGIHTKIIAVTAHALEEERREILSAGYDDFIRKPYKYEDIIDALTKYLGVRFSYAQEQAAPAVPVYLEAAALARVPEELLNELEQALVRLDIDAVHAAIEKLLAHDPSLKDALEAMSRDLQFGRILRMIRTAKAGTDVEEEI